MDLTLWIVSLVGLSALLFAVWWRELGVVKAALALICRVGLIVLVLTTLRPQKKLEKIQKQISVEPIYVFIDDSLSMRAVAGEVLKQIEVKLHEMCEHIGCEIRIQKLSELYPQEVEQGYTPLADALEVIRKKSFKAPWIIVSDGGDWYPHEPWPASLAQLNQETFKKQDTESKPIQYGQPLLLAPWQQGQQNLWISKVQASRFAFEQQVSRIDVGVKRSLTGSEQRVQVQVVSWDKVLATRNLNFSAGDAELVTDVVLPAMRRGQKLLQVRVLPAPDEQAVWDNGQNIYLDVLPNTVGVLHLLGAPSWDGRFMRRYLKSEPKYDVISFFILRDPWDQQAVDERELSLIPFPVRRLFLDELPNFKVVIMQNFTLFQFLEPEYQRALVDFVKKGGGLLFLGGDRALQSLDLASSSLSEILPFLTTQKIKVNSPIPMFSRFRRQQDDRQGPWYDPGLSFQIKVAPISDEKRNLSVIFDHWSEQAEVLGRMAMLKGMHHTENIKLKETGVAPLLTAVTSSGQSLPLAVASYPEKGRALWLFTDQLWRLAMENPVKIARQAYHDFIHAAMTWLLRQELQPPLVLEHLLLRKDAQGGVLKWRVSLRGPAVRYFKLSPMWTIRICGVELNTQQILLQRQSRDVLELRGELSGDLTAKAHCRLTIKGEDPAFGSVTASLAAEILRRYRDVDLGSSASRVHSLNELIHAHQVNLLSDHLWDDVKVWLENQKSTQTSMLDQHELSSSLNHYWVFDHVLGWLVLLLLLPIEALIRRWDQLFH